MIKYFDKMKKNLSILVVLLLAVSAFAQNPKLSYQAVVRDSENKLVVEQPVTVTMNVLTAGNTSQFEQTLNATTNRNGLMSLEIGNDTPAWNNINWTGAKIRTAITLSSGAEVVDTTVVNAVPFAMYANSVNTKAIPQSDWAENDNTKCSFILNKPSIKDTVNNILTTGNYVTTTMIDARGYLTADSAVITTMQGNITTNAGNIATNANNITTNTNAIAAAVNKEHADSTTLASRIDALEGAAATNCNGVKACIADTLNAYTTTDNLMTLLNAMNDKINSLNDALDSISDLIDSLTKITDGEPCPGTPFVFDVDNNIYNTVQIGMQCWMKENLRTTSINNIGEVSETSYGNVTTYGRLYSWNAMMQGSNSTNYPESGDKVQGICPTGWHVPSQNEWKTLFAYVKTEYPCGGESITRALSSKNYWNTDGVTDPCAPGYDLLQNNASGFSAVQTNGNVVTYWTSTENPDNGNNAYEYFWNSKSPSYGLYNEPKSYKHSVRCLKD